MRFLALVFCGLALETGCFAQLESSVPDLTIDKFNNSISPFISAIKSKKKSDFKVVQKLFNKAHRDLLKNYVAYSQVDDIFKNGNYDCLSGTYFFALALDELK